MLHRLPDICMTSHGLFDLANDHPGGREMEGCLTIVVLHGLPDICTTSPKIMLVAEKWSVGCLKA